MINILANTIDLTNLYLYLELFNYMTMFYSLAKHDI